MTRIASATTLYAILATLVLAAPLAASEQPAEQAVVEEVVAPAEPDAVAPEIQPVPAQPEPEPEPVPEPEASQLVDTVPVEERPQKPRLRTAKAAASGTVTISDFKFAPASVTVEVGDSVTWSNAGPTAHSATGEGFDTGIFSEGQSRSETFKEAGTFAYICTPHPQMKGTVVVQAAAAQGQDEEGSSETGAGSGSGDDGSTGADSGTAAGGGTPADSGSTATLPATGLDAGGALVMGLVALGLGAFLRRRAATTG